MKHRITMESAINFTTTAIKPGSCWAPAAGSSRFAHIRHNFILLTAIVNILATFASSIYNVYRNRHNPSRMIKIISEASCLAMTGVRMIIWKIKTPQLEVLMNEMKTSLNQATLEEKELMQSYVDKCLLPHIIIFVSTTFGVIGFIAAPMVTSQPLPGDFAHPFRTDIFWVWALLYVSQSICTIQVGCMCYSDVFCAILLWYAGARFDLLAMELQSATDDKDVCRCAWKHQKLIKYVDKLRACTRTIAVTVVATTIITVTAGGFVLIRRPPPYEFAKYMCYELASAMELFLFTWPADNLIDVSRKLGDAAYGCDWIGKSPQMHKDLLIVIERSRSPLHIAVDGLLPILSLEFYGSTLVTTFSYLTTLRAFAGD